MARGDIREAESLLELASQRARDASTLLRLATVRRSLGDFPGALKAAAAAVELEPRNFLMCLLLGSLRETMGAPHAAERAYRAAVACAPLDLSFQPAVARQLEWAKQWAAGSERWRKRLLEWAPESQQLDPAEERRMRGFRANLLENLDAGATAPPAFLIPGIKSKRYFDPAEFRGVREVERATSVIRDEFLALAAAKSDELSSRLAGLHSTEGELDRNGHWSMIPLMRNGRVFEDYASRCPLTMELVQGLDLAHLPLISPSIYYSVLEPGSRISPHTGLTNARLIAHFPLIVPENCRFRVGGETRVWSEGEALIFDDMTMHEAWNDSDRIRVVLIVDLWRPELSLAERAAIRDLLDFSEPQRKA